MGATGLKRVAELKTILLEREDVELLVVEIAVEFVAMACETALVQIPPYGSHHVDDLHLVEVIVDNRAQVFIDTEDGDSIQIGQHIIDHAVFLTLWKRVTVEGFDVTLLKLFYRHYQRFGINHHLNATDIFCQNIHRLECLSEIGWH